MKMNALGGPYILEKDDDLETFFTSFFSEEKPITCVSKLVDTDSPVYEKIKVCLSS